jgi:hypothetical protein
MLALCSVQSGRCSRPQTKTELAKEKSNPEYIGILQVLGCSLLFTFWSVRGVVLQQQRGERKVSPSDSSLGNHFHTLHHQFNKDGFNQERQKW